jgi:hypothetical protein
MKTRTGIAMDVFNFVSPPHLTIVASSFLLSTAISSMSRKPWRRLDASATAREVAAGIEIGQQFGAGARFCSVGGLEESRSYE